MPTTPRHRPHATKSLHKWDRCSDVIKDFLFNGKARNLGLYKISEAMDKVKDLGTRPKPRPRPRSMLFVLEVLRGRGKVLARHITDKSYTVGHKNTPILFHHNLEKMIQF